MYKLNVNKFKSSLNNKYHQQLIKRTAFTIVELLIVIVVIGVLAAITIISYSNITNKSKEVSLQSDLSDSKTKLQMYYSDYGSYPTEMSGPDTQGKLCPSAPTATIDDNYCLIPSSGNVFEYSGTASTFYLENTNSGITYHIAESLTPTIGEYTPPPIIDPNWIAGLVGTPLEGKWVYHQDLALSAWGPSDVICPTGTGGSQPCEVGIDPNYATYRSLVSPQTYPSIDFSAYPAQNSCKAIGGRLGTMTEVLAIYNGMSSYGNNFNLVNKPYWSTIENNSTTAGTIVFFSSGSAMTFGKTNLYSVICVKD
ncbi:MAG: prepilin-type N-terminal cleavage/methylation domain-containing protein [Candidatus Saccharimonadales bacterium]